MRKLNPLFYALVASSSIAGVATADDGVVLSVRPDGVVADVSPMEDVRRGTKLGFVREDGEREETGQGRVLHVRDGKAQVKLATKSDVKKGDLVVLCPDLNEDPYDELRATVAEIQEQAGQGSTARKRSSRLHEATSKLQAALEARDEAVEEGLCDMASHDAKIEALAQDLAKVSAGRKTATARAPGQGSRPTPAQKSEDQEAADEEPAKPKAGATTEEQYTQVESEADEES